MLLVTLFVMVRPSMQPFASWYRSSCYPLIWYHFKWTKTCFQYPWPGKSVRNAARLRPAVGWGSRVHTWIYWAHLICECEPSTTGRHTRGRGYRLSLPDTEWNEQWRLPRRAGGGVSEVQSGATAIQMVLPVPDVLLLGFKAPWQTRHSPSTSLMRAPTRKAAPETFWTGPQHRWSMFFCHNTEVRAILEQSAGQLSTT